MLSLMRGDNAEIGWYSAAARLIDIVVLIPFIVLSGVFPVVSHIYLELTGTCYGVWSELS